MPVLMADQQDSPGGDGRDGASDFDDAPLGVGETLTQVGEHDYAFGAPDGGPTDAGPDPPDASFDAPPADEGCHLGGASSGYAAAALLFYAGLLWRRR